MLSERRKADRAAMLAGVVALLNHLHVDYADVTEELLGMCPRRVAVELRLPRGLCLTVDFDGDSPQPDCHVLSWRVSTRSSACLSDVFQSVNNYHFQKATDIAEGYEPPRRTERLSRRPERMTIGGDTNRESCRGSRRGRRSRNDTKAD
jgi:hypothetical protein